MLAQEKEVAGPCPTITSRVFEGSTVITAFPVCVCVCEFISCVCVCMCVWDNLRCTVTVPLLITDLAVSAFQSDYHWGRGEVCDYTHSSVGNSVGTTTISESTNTI